MRHGKSNCVVLIRKYKKKILKNFSAFCCPRLKKESTLQSHHKFLVHQKWNSIIQKVILIIVIDIKHLSPWLHAVINKIFCSYIDSKLAGIRLLNNWSSKCLKKIFLIFTLKCDLASTPGSFLDFIYFLTWARMSTYVCVFVIQKQNRRMNEMRELTMNF